MMRSKVIEAYYLKRRTRIFESGLRDAAWVFFSPRIHARNDDVNHPFRQDSHYYYLTGFDASDSISILVWDQDKGKPAWHIFLEPRDSQKELWEGSMYGLDGAKSIFGADQAYPLHEFSVKAPELLKNHKHIYYRLGKDPSQDQQFHNIVSQAIRKGGRTGKWYPVIEDPQTVLGQMRLIKSTEEINLMKQAAHGSALAHKKIMVDLCPGMNEREVEGVVDAAFRMHGCSRNGYPSIVAAGKNATCLHYTNNNQNCVDGELLLIDAGGEYEYYTADITRTFPVGDAFTSEQEKLYDIVLRAQKKCIAAIKPGITFVALQNIAVDVLTQGMIDLGLVVQDKDVYIKEKKYRAFYPHNLGHWLGLDVHDVGAYYTPEGEAIPFEPGMVCTIEPGIYIQPDDKNFPETYRGIGIRIEDDVLVTEDGYDVLTFGVPKEKNEILELRKNKKG